MTCRSWSVSPARLHAWPIPSRRAERHGSGGVAHSQSAQTPARRRRADLASWPDERPLTQILPNLWQRPASPLPIESHPRVIAVDRPSCGARRRSIDDDDLRVGRGRWQTHPSARLGDVLGDGWIQPGGAIATYAIGKLTARAGGRPTSAAILIRAQAPERAADLGVIKVTRRSHPTERRAFLLPVGPHVGDVRFRGRAAVALRLEGRDSGVCCRRFVCWTRVRDHAHWISDVALPAPRSASSSANRHARHRQRDWSVVPTKTPGVFAVYVTRVK